MPAGEIADPRAAGGELELLPNARGEQMAMLYFPPSRANAPVVAYWHGNAGQLGWDAAILGRELVDRFGVGFVGLEYPGYGLAGGEPKERAIYEDAEGLLRHLVDKRQVSNSSLVLLGHSLGGGVAVEMARRGYGSGVALISPFQSISAMAVELFPFLKVVKSLVPFFVLDNYDNLGKIQDLKQPVLIIHGTEDEIVPFE